MPRWTFDRDEAALDDARRAYQRVLAGWAGDCLTCRRDPIAWTPPDPQADYLDRDWSRLYTGSVLDD